LHDGITFERLGIPSAVVITEPFIPAAEVITDLDGLPDYGYVAIPHPVTSLSLEQLAARAREVARHVEAILLGTDRAPVGPQSENGPLTGDDVAEVLHPYRLGLQSDGADLLVDAVSGDDVHARLTFSDETCMECVMPSGTVREVLAGLLSTHYGRAVGVTLEDPRDAPDDRNPTTEPTT
jgi:hypothetical protein